MATNPENIAVCSLCQKALSLDNEIASDPATNGVCGDCKFLLLEDFGSHMVTPQSSQRRLRGRFRHNSSESGDSVSSQQHHYVVNAAGQNHSTSYVEDDQFVDGGDTSAWSLQHGSVHTTPSGSRSWRRVLSDTDSDGFDNWGSLYGENESNASLRRYRAPNGETDSFSFSAYGADSDISMDRHSVVDAGVFNLPDEVDEFDSDTDIDPMHAGFSHWNSDDMEDEEEEDEEEEEEEEDVEEEEEEEREWELAEVDEADAMARLQIFSTASPSESWDGNGWVQRITSTEFERAFSQAISNRLQAYNDHSFTNLEDADFPPYGTNFGDYIDARNFEDLLEHLAENDISRRGAPPAAVSFVKNLPRVVIGKEHEKHGELVCAVCKDVLAHGTEVNQLPCSHLYHSGCIRPWLSARNSCPLCRYELPTDDKDYEEGKQNIEGSSVIHERQQQLQVMDDSSSYVSDGAEVNEVDGTSQQREVVSSRSATNASAVRGGRGRWIFLAAAPIVSLVGIVLVLWLGNSQIERNRQLGGRNILVQNQHAVHNQRESRSRRWWCPF